MPSVCIANMNDYGEKIEMILNWPFFTDPS